MVEIVDVHKSYGATTVLDGVDLVVNPGEVTVLIGPSGAGKSTLLRMINHLEKADRGLVLVAGELIGYRRVGNHLRELREKEVLRQRTGIGFVFQDFKLFPSRTVLENVSFVPRVLGVAAAQQQRRAFQVLKWVGLQHRMNAYPRDLSGGEQQRIAIARALVSDPVLLLADEPTGNLDPELSLEIMNLLREVNAGGTTVLVATHDRELIRLVGRRTVTLDAGRLVEVA